MNRLEKIKIIVKRTEYFEVEISESQGYDMPNTLTETIEIVNDVKTDYQDYISDAEPTSTEFKLEHFEIIEGEK